MQNSFYSIYQHGFIRTAACVPKIQVAHPAKNVQYTLDLARQASEQGAALALFPELGISAYTNDDLFHQGALLEATKSALAELVQESRELSPLLLVGAPLRFGGALYNCSVVIYRGTVLGIVPKTYLPNYREFYEKRQFTAARANLNHEVNFLGQDVPFGNNLIFTATNLPDFILHTEICEDVWTPIPPSTYAALAGATVLTNLSASNITVGKAEYRRGLCANQSAKCVAAYLYSAAGFGESTTDLAWDGHALIYENGAKLAESERFADDAELILADVDLERLVQERMRLTSFADSIGDHRERLQSIRQIPFTFEVPESLADAENRHSILVRSIDRFPYVPGDPTVRNERCAEVYNIQVQGLMQRLTATGIKKVVIGISGGLDSTQALIVAARTMDRLGLPRENILAYTMPGFATSDHTRDNAHALMKSLGVTAQEIDIRSSAMQMLRDIGHPYSDVEEASSKNPSVVSSETSSGVYDVTFENVQAGERTSHLFRLANYNQALVVGTGDLSELALGWATYGVGDQMSHYNVNASVPKTLIQYLIRWIIETDRFGPETGVILQSILDTEITPELIPAGKDNGGQPVQSTQAKIGPYELQDFHLYYISRFGFQPSKVAFLAHHAWGNKDVGFWSDLLPPDQRNEYDLATIKHWLEVFLFRFFAISQFKRSAMPNGPKVGSGGSLSPRGDWRAPSDSSADVWLTELRDNVPA